MVEQLPGPAHLVLLAAVARRYYLGGQSKIEIAQDLSISRFKVARLLEEARTSGLVQIEIRYPGSVDVNLSARLRERYGLRHAVVVDTADEDPLLLRGHLGRAAAELLEEIVTSGDVLGLGWARSLLDMTAALKTLPSCSVVQLTGALSRPDVDASSIEIVRQVAGVAKGPAYFFYAPMIVPDAATAAALLGQPDIARAIARFPSVTKAVVAIGSWLPPFSTVYDAIGGAERDSLVDLGVRADVSGVLLDGAGSPVEAPLSQRMICITAGQLREVPEVIALAYGVQKADAVRAAVHGGYVNGLVTHSALAELLVGGKDGKPVAAGTGTSARG